MTLSEELAWRGFVNQTTYPDHSALDGDPITFYFGVDPSADSMTIGNLASALMVRHFIDHGHRAILLVGGATGMIGDPDGKKQERDLLSLDEIAHNKNAIAEQYKTVFAGQDFEIVDNYDWFKDMNYLTFLRDVGKHVPMRQMLGREFVSQRLSEDGAGISYAEFSYSLIQGYDFLHLHREKGATLQLCGADQWGNSIAGVELIRRIAGSEAHVWSAPLVVNKSTGVKFGKTEGGAVWLDPRRTPSNDFFQFWFNLDDEGVIDYLKIYTLLSREEIEDIERRFNEDRASRLAQEVLAYEVTKLVHGEERANSAREGARHGRGNLNDRSAEYFVEKAETMLTFDAQIGVEGNIVDAIVGAGLASSRTQAREFMDSGAIYINNEKLPINKLSFEQSDSRNGYAIIRRGKKTEAIVRFTQPN